MSIFKKADEYDELLVYGPDSDREFAFRDDFCFLIEDKTQGEADDAYVYVTPEEAEQLVDFISAELPRLRTTKPSVNEALIRLAIEYERPIAFRYAKGDDQRVIETRKIDPKSIYAGSVGQVVYGYDHDRSSTRAFRLDRIKGRVRVG